MEQLKNPLSLDGLADEIFNSSFIDSVLAELYKYNCQFLRIFGDKKAYLFTRQLTKRTAEIKKRVQEEKQITLRDSIGREVEIKEFDYFFFPYITEEGDNEEVFHNSYSNLRRSLCDKNQHLVVVLIDIENKLKIRDSYHINIGHFIDKFTQRDQQNHFLTM